MVGGGWLVVSGGIHRLDYSDTAPLSFTFLMFFEPHLFLLPTGLGLGNGLRPRTLPLPLALSSGVRPRSPLPSELIKLEFVLISGIPPGFAFGASSVCGASAVAGLDGGSELEFQSPVSSSVVRFIALLELKANDEALGLPMPKPRYAC